MPTTRRENAMQGRVICVLEALSVAVAVGAREDGGPAPLVWDFENGAEDWAPSTVDAGSVSVGVAGGGIGGGTALAVGGKTPKSFGVSYLPWHDWRGFTTLSFSVQAPKGVPNDLDLYVYVKDRQYLWYQTAPLHDKTTGKRTGSIKPGEWMTFTVDVSEDSTAWEPGGHEKAWNRSLYYPREFGFRFFSEKAWSGVVLIDNMRLEGSEPPLGVMEGGSPGPGRGRLSVEANTDTLKILDKFELTFALDRDYVSPFDPEVVDVQGHFKGPDGERLMVNGFYYQDYRRTLTQEGFEKLIPVGEPSWKVRFSPRKPGTYEYFVVVNDAWGQLRSEAGSFTAADVPGHRGVVRVSEQDPRYFEFENGEFFFPTGINMRDGGDHAEKQKGTYDFDYFFQRFDEEGLDFVRTWMCGWWAGIEWSEDYHSRYDGVGRYAMYNAWRLDYLLNLAQQHDIYLEITLNSHGQFRRDKFDAEWQYNPYAAQNGGFLASPSMFFTSERAKRMVRQRNRYIVSRWGWCPQIMSWDMVNEVDLVEGYSKPEVAAWHAEMARYIRSIDISNRLITSHICLYWGYGTELWDLPEIQYIQADAYWERESEKGMNKCWASRQQYNKPFLFIEYGPQTASLPIPANSWKRDFRVGMWVSNLMPTAAPGQFWYHREWDEHELYEYQKGLFAYNEGEDRRSMGLKTTPGTAKADDGRELSVQAMANDQRAYVYIYDYESMLFPTPDEVPDARRVKGGTVRLQGPKPGSYTATFYDTLTGAVVGTQDVECEAGGMMVPLPAFGQDIALKVTPR
ncbi:MAG TPA: hypothetical protein DGT21_21575 [Armatimonadetes bacterium]|nr:hypothetical protein [Armatimonadota bacterium]